MWAKLTKGVIGTDHVDAQLGDGLDPEVALGLPAATIDEVCQAGGTVVLLGPDLKEELPVLFLRLRDAVVNHGVQVIEVAPQAGGFTPYATVSLRPAPGRGRRRRPGPARRQPLRHRCRRARPHRPRRGSAAGGHRPGAGRGRSPIGGRVRPWRDRRRLGPARHQARHHLPGRPAPGQRRGAPWTWAWPRACCRAGSAWTRAGTGSPGGGPTCLVPAASTPPASWPRRPTVPSTCWCCWGPTRCQTSPITIWPARGLAGAGTVVAVDRFATDSVQAAEVILPAAGFAEVEGTTTNLEGRVSAVHAKVTAPGTARRRLDHRRRAGRRPGGRSGPRLDRRHPHRDRPGGTGLRWA